MKQGEEEDSNGGGGEEQLRFHSAYRGDDLLPLPESLEPKQYEDWEKTFDCLERGRVIDMLELLLCCLLP